ncbi:MAG: alpha-glucosidase [Anaerolineales bacterium]|nr:alpha-glucosidase [Chloroflexota bacterium]MBL6981495.1 alpha-glucosidase [Anaerolineales bacterium]
MTNALPWWQTTTIYQIYPRSFKDSNGDGIGDLKGIISKLDYVKELGFETIWISPFFCSPQEDYGYDISDYYDVALEYGDLNDVQNLIEEIHARGMRVLFDLVMNHTSADHAWFQESRSSRNNPKRNWYIWRDGKGERPPNNWKAMPGGSGWHYDYKTEQYYYASFLPFQPDLNYRNPEVRETMLGIAKFWLDKGVDGFRLDIFHSVFKDEQLRDNPISLHYIPHNDEAGFFQRWKYQVHQPETFQLAISLRSLAKEYSPEKMLVGEVFGSNEILKQYLGADQDGLNLVFLWELLRTKPIAKFFREVIQHHEEHYPPPFVPVYVYGNHDQKRIISKVGNDPKIAKLLALLQFTVRGVPVTYYGEEIGMSDVYIPAKKALDPIGQRYKWAPKFLIDALNLYINRDGCRTPMQWDDSANAGFCSNDTDPWLPVHENYSEVNVECQMGDEGSLLNVYRKLLYLRRDNRVLREGTLQLLDESADLEELLIYRRDCKDETVLIVINFENQIAQFNNQTGCDQIIFSVGYDQTEEFNGNSLEPFSGVILRG